MSKQELSAIDKYERYLADEEARKANYTDMVSSYDDVTNNFFEFDWGESIHLAPRWKGETLRESLKRHEHHLAFQLALQPGMKVLDVGCGIGGPLIEIARFSSTSITGLNNNEYQVKRGIELTKMAGLEKTCDFVQADFMKIPFPDNTFDAVYAIEAIYHAPDTLGCYKEIYRVLKPGQLFAAYEWCMTKHFDPNNEEHKKIKRAVELGHGDPDIRPATERIEALKLAGFEVIREKNLAEDSPVPWYSEIETIHEKEEAQNNGLAPNGSQRIHSFLEKATEAIVKAGREEIFTPMYFFLARKQL